MSKSTQGPISTRAQLRDKCILLASVTVIVLAASSSIMAQTDPAPVDGAIPPPREGNTYDHKDHQPTEAEVSRAEAAAGSRPLSVNAAHVEKGVEEFLRQMDKLDEQSEERIEGH